MSSAASEKRRRRKQERDRKKRKRRELRAKEKAAKAPEGAEAAEPPPEAPREEAQARPGLLFNKVSAAWPSGGRRWPQCAGPGRAGSGARLTSPSSPEVEVSEEEPGSKAQRRKEKRQKLKGNLTPLTGRNYRQLLERLQARQARLEELRDQDAGQARELEAKMQWTNVLYKAEGVKIRDDERLLQEALKRKEKRRAQRQRAWEKRTAHVVGKMQQRQDRRRQNLREKKAARAERRLEKARKKGRILPQDLERAGLA